jgi:Na+-driven multidrug efflux pump
MFLNVVYNFYFIPTQGILGAAIATAFAYLTSQFVGIIYYKKEIALKFLIRSLLPLHYIKGTKK